MPYGIKRAMWVGDLRAFLAAKVPDRQLETSILPLAGAAADPNEDQEQ